MKSLEHLSKYLNIISFSVKYLRFVALVVGVGLTTLGHFNRGSAEENWLANNADVLFWVGLSVLLLTNLLLVFVDRQSIEILRSLHAEEQKNALISEELASLQGEKRALAAWVTLTKLISELIDQAIDAQAIDDDAANRLYGAAVEFIAEYRNRLFGIEDDYINISIYEFNTKINMLTCVACYRSRPSDAKGPRRSWGVGEGHVGKAFELQNELVCGDATAPDVAAWIAAPPGKRKEDDAEKFVSLAAIPVAISASEPLGVVIMTSSERYRFININDLEGGYPDEVDVQRAKYAVAALQDIAAQIAQLMSILQSKRSNQEGGLNETGT